MQTVATRQAVIKRAGVRLDSDLLHIATPVLDLIMQVKAGLLTPSADMRLQISDLLRELEVEGDHLGYKERQVQEAKFALAAFVDETVLTARFPLRDEWEKHPLQLEYFGEHLAGVTFFNRLDQLMQSAASDADAIEVYYLCLLLGYKGKHKIYFEDELKIVIEKVADSLRRVNRLRDIGLSPHWRVNDQPEPIDHGIPGWIKTGGLIAICSAILIYAIFTLWLHSDLSAAMERLLR